MERGPDQSGGGGEAERGNEERGTSDLLAHLKAIRDAALEQDNQRHGAPRQPEAAAGLVSADKQSAPDGPKQAREASQAILANVYADPGRHTVTLLLDDVTANSVMYAVRVLAADAEAHAREVRLVAAAMPIDSWGAANRHAIASRHERIARRLRELDRNYYNVITAPGGGLERPAGNLKRYEETNGGRPHRTDA